MPKARPGSASPRQDASRRNSEPTETEEPLPVSPRGNRHACLGQARRGAIPPVIYIAINIAFITLGFPISRHAAIVKVNHGTTSPLVSFMNPPSSNYSVTSSRIFHSRYVDGEKQPMTFWKNGTRLKGVGCYGHEAGGSIKGNREPALQAGRTSSRGALQSSHMGDKCAY